MTDIYGIDLGTTNSCICRLVEGVPEIVPVEGSPVVPSVVSFEGGEPIVGQKARNRALLYPQETVASVKRMMGEQESVHVGGRYQTPEELSSHILDYLKRSAEKEDGRTVERVVITVPAYFSDAQRRATRQAGEMAGLRVERVLNEPTAAALFYDSLGLEDSRSDAERTVLVYDLGGGTFDVSVLRLGEITEVLASTGNTKLGGDDFDQAIMERCLERIQSDSDLDLSWHRAALTRLKHAAEQAKITLSDHPFAGISEPLLPTPEGESVDLDLELSREEFERDLSSYLESTRDEVHRALREAGVHREDVHWVLPVGGSTRLPAVIRLLEEEFGSSRMPVVDPDLSVAKGAAIQGGIIEGSHVGQILIDVTSHSLSTLALVDRLRGTLKCVPIISRNTQIPVTRSEVFQTVLPEQERVEVTVYQGESEDPEENELIGTLDLALAPAPEGTPVTVEFSYDLNGIIRVNVEQKGYSRKREVDMDSSRREQSFISLDDGEMDQEPLPDEEENPETDPSLFDSERKGQVTNYILKKARGLLESLDREEERSELGTLIRDYENALQDGDEDTVDDTEEALVDFMEKIEERNG